MKLVMYLYLTDIAHNINNFLNVIIAAYILSLVVLGIFWILSNDGYSEKLHEQINNILKRVTKYWWVASIVMCVSAILPSQRTMYLMLGSAYLSESNLPTKVYQALELKLDDVIRDMKKDK